eukprot:CAMPEP_0170413922 /NCGR_PEP_ID=MMETSP0117_2-20130122/31791_1 /TAXON_ID=400756 /ORGANISM="Durinskia baltica, Strain CSIRO CS-38" /LENGTH=60 /DNA_ID=CAMNT_0010671773 /DNA_START=50 /DNA_END=228 /DNA_ORIENTATION=-
MPPVTACRRRMLLPSRGACRARPLHAREPTPGVLRRNTAASLNEGKSLRLDGKRQGGGVR